MQTTYFKELAARELRERLISGASIHVKPHAQFSGVFIGSRLQAIYTLWTEAEARKRELEAERSKLWSSIEAAEALALAELEADRESEALAELAERIQARIEYADRLSAAFRIVSSFRALSPSSRRAAKRRALSFERASERLANYR